MGDAGMGRKLHGLLKILALVLAGACSLAAQSRNAGDLAAGKLLVASHEISDPIFARSVILLVGYNRTGALGLMLNHRTKLPISRTFKDLKEAAKKSDTVFVGGPVELDSVFVLWQAVRPPGGAKKVAGDIYFIETKAGLKEALGAGYSSSHIHVYLGYCGWAPGQLENEVMDGGWYIFSGRQDLAFDRAPATLWERLIGETQQRTVMLRYGEPIAFGVPAR